MRWLTAKFIYVLLIGIFVSATLCAQKASPGPWITHGEVNRMTRGDGKIFMSGEFDWVGIPDESGLAIFNTELVPDPSYSDINYFARLAVSDDAGGWYVVAYGAIAHLKADKTIEDLPITVENGGYGINAIDKEGNFLYIGGDFTSINGMTRKYVASIDLTTNTLTNWNPDANGYVYSIKASGSTVYVGGSFAAIGGQTRAKIAAIDASTGLATSWNANVVTSFGYVLTIEVGASGVYFGGNFSNVGGGSPSRRNFAAVNATTGALIAAVNPRPDDIVGTILLDGNTLYIEGDFNQIAGIAKPNLAALDVTTGSLTAFNTTLSNVSYENDIYALAVDGQKLFLGGSFSVVNGVEQPNLAVVNKTTGISEPMEDMKIAGQVYTVAVSGGAVLAGGSIAGISGVSRHKGVAAIDENTGEATEWYPSGIIGYSLAGLHFQDDRVYYLSNEGEDGYIGALNTTDGAAIPGWEITTNNEISSWAFADGVVYISGVFTMVNGVSKTDFAAVDLETGDVLPWTISYALSRPDDERITSMIVSNNVLYAAGEFSFTDGGLARNKLAAWDATTGMLLPWSPVISLAGLQVNIGAVHDAKVFLIGDVVRRADAVTGELDEWQPEFADGDGVASVAISGNSVFLAGSFSPGLVNVDLNNGKIIGWQPELYDVYQAEASVNAIILSETRLFAGGNFWYGIDDDVRSNYAEYIIPEFSNPPPVIVEDLVAACSGTDAFITIEATGPNITYQWQKLDENTQQYEDLTDDDEYAGATASTLTIITFEDFGSGDYRCYVSTDEGALFTNVATVTVSAIPAAPSASDDGAGLSCGPATVTLIASDGTDGQYKWYDSATGNSDLGETGEQFVTPELTVTTSYFVSIVGDGCESERTEVVASVLSQPSPPSVTGAIACSSSAITLTASGGTPGNYRWYDAATEGSDLGETNDQFITPVLTTTTSYYVSIVDECESERIEVKASVLSSPSAPTVAGAAGCSSSAITLTASGGTSGNYRWYDVATGGSALGETNGQFVTPVLAATTSYYVSITNGCESARIEVTASVVSPPSAPSVTGASGCSSSAITLTASGGTPGNYRWYGVATGGSALGETSAQFVTPALTATTSYYVSIVNGCESARTEVTASIISLPYAPSVTGASACSSSAITLNASGGTAGNYRWYSEATGGVAISNAINSSYTTPPLTATTTYYVSVVNGICEGPRTGVIATITGPCNQPPSITTRALATETGGIITLDLVPLISTANNNLDINSIQVTVPPSSGADASVVNGMLTIRYTGIAFAGIEQITIQACDLNGNCAAQQFNIEVEGDILVYNAISPGGANPTLIMMNIELLPETKNNKVTIYDRWQNEVWRSTNYNNSTTVFNGTSDRGSDLPTGTYFYKIEFNGGRKTKTGFISLKR